MLRRFLEWLGLVRPRLLPWSEAVRLLTKDYLAGRARDIETARRVCAEMVRKGRIEPPHD